jgi:hypothetical protein
MWLISIHGLSLQRTDSRKPIHIHSWKFFCIFFSKSVLWFVGAIGFQLLADRANWHIAAYLFDLQQEIILAIGSIAASLFQSADWFPAISICKATYSGLSCRNRFCHSQSNGSMRIKDLSIDCWFSLDRTFKHIAIIKERRQTCFVIIVS